MISNEIIFLVYCLVVLFLWIVWVAVYGFRRGSLAAILRVFWTIPLVLAFFPVQKLDKVPRSLSMQPFHILVDDSNSMKKNSIDGKESLSEIATGLLDELGDMCSEIGCSLQVTYLSQLDSSVKEGLTPLNLSLDAWMYTTNDDPWLIISDGGDSSPASPWSSSLSGSGKERGMLLGFRPDKYNNHWIDDIDIPLFSFEERPINVGFTLKRDKEELVEETIQTQVILGSKALATVNATFANGENAIDVQIPIGSLPRGRHLLEIKALPTSDEKIVWDNIFYREIEVMPNTIGVLHLLGTPSWDGRFLRRFLKSEPKYDLISFFILRDPGDTQSVNERELSLIPFPVDRLFNEELPNFHSVVIQNFALYQFLDTVYQNNLVKFVKEGGGLLFIGGPRALKDGDYAGAPLASILPFDLKNKPKSVNNNKFLKSFRGKQNKNGPWYDPNTRFTVKLSDPNLAQRSLANVFDDWEELGAALAKQESFQGLHHMENVDFKDGYYTPLLDAQTSDGRTVPLAIASYPGKGRALWLFSDSFWKIALSPSGDNSRNVYSRFLSSAMTWLLRQEFRKPLILSNLVINATDKKTTNWKMQVTGPAARFIQKDGDWHVKICGIGFPVDKLNLEKSGPENWLMGGALPATVTSGSRCEAEVRGQHKAFGEVRAMTTTVVPETFDDVQISVAPNRLKKLADLMQAEISFYRKGELSTFWDWAKKMGQNEKISWPAKFKTVSDHYWFLEYWWYLVLFCALPLEILVRRWNYLTGVSNVSR